MNNVCIIPARAGSTRIPKKNIKDFYGKPIIAYSIEAAQRSELFDSIIVTTDGEDIAAVADSYGATVFTRSRAMAHNDIGTQEVTKDVLSELIGVDYACCLYATVPMIDDIELRKAHAHLRFNSRLDYVIPVANWLEDPGRWYFGKASSFLNEVPLIGAGTAMMRVDKNRSIDINTPEDWDKAEKMYERLIGSF